MTLKETPRGSIFGRCAAFVEWKDRKGPWTSSSFTVIFLLHEQVGYQPPSGLHGRRRRALRWRPSPGCDLCQSGPRPATPSSRTIWGSRAWLTFPAQPSPGTFPAQPSWWERRGGGGEPARPGRQRGRGWEPPARAPKLCALWRPRRLGWGLKGRGSAPDAPPLRPGVPRGWIWTRAEAAGVLQGFYLKRKNPLCHAWLQPRLACWTSSPTP